MVLLYAAMFNKYVDLMAQRGCVTLMAQRGCVTLKFKNMLKPNFEVH
jgi:hypothetical protein